MGGDVAKTTVAVSDADKDNGNMSPAAVAFSASNGGIGENIYGPFEAGVLLFEQHVGTPRVFKNISLSVSLSLCVCACARACVRAHVCAGACACA